MFEVASAKFQANIVRNEDIMVLKSSDDLEIEHQEYLAHFATFKNKLKPCYTKLYI